MVEYNFDENELNRASINIDRTVETPKIIDHSSNPSEKFKREVMLFLDQAKRSPARKRDELATKG